MAEDSHTLIQLPIPVVLENAVWPSRAGEVVGKVARFDKRKIEESEAVASCANVELNRKACIERSQFRGSQGIDTAVYIVGTASDNVSKIGISRDPLRRLASLQAGAYQRLRLTHLFWMPHKAAIGIEKLSLRIIARLGSRLSGEWVDMPPDNAAISVAAILHSSAIPYSNSAMFLESIRNAYDLREHGAMRGAPKRDPESFVLQMIDSKRT